MARVFGTIEIVPSRGFAGDQESEESGEHSAVSTGKAAQGIGILRFPQNAKSNA